MSVDPRRPFRPQDRTQDELQRDFDQRRKDFEQLKAQIIKDHGVDLASKFHARGELEDGEAIGRAVDIFATKAAMSGIRSPKNMDPEDRQRALVVAEDEASKAIERERSERAAAEAAAKLETEKKPEAELAKGAETPAPGQPQQNQAPHNDAPNPARGQNHYAELNETHQRVDGQRLHKDYRAAADEVTGWAPPNNDGPRGSAPGRSGPGSGGPDTTPPAGKGRDPKNGPTSDGEQDAAVGMTAARAARLERLRGNFGNEASTREGGRVRNASQAEPDRQSPGVHSPQSSSSRDDKDMDDRNTKGEMTDVRAARLQRLQGASAPKEMTERGQQAQNDGGGSGRTKGGASPSM